MTDLFGETAPAPATPRPVKKAPPKPLMSSEYYTLLEAAGLLNADPDHAQQILAHHAVSPVVTATPEMFPCYSRAEVNQVAATRQAAAVREAWRG